MSDLHYYALLGKDNEVIHVQKENPYGKFDPHLVWVEYLPENVVKVGYFYNPVSKTFYRKVSNIADRKRGLLFTVNEICDRKIDALTESYPKNERTTFDLQRTEAAGWVMNNESPTPFIDRLCFRRGIDKVEMIKRVNYKAVLLATAMGDIIGIRQSLEDKLDVLKTHDELDELEDEIGRWGRT